MAVLLEEDRRRLQAQRNLELLQSYNVDVRSELQQQISQIQEKSLKQVSFNTKEQCIGSRKMWNSGQEIPTAVQNINGYILAGFKSGKLVVLDENLEKEIHKRDSLDRKQFANVLNELVPSELGHIFNQAPDNFSFYGSVTRIQLIDKVAGANILISVQLKHGSLFLFVTENLTPVHYIYFPGKGIVSTQVSTMGGQMLVSTPGNDLIHVDVMNRQSITELMGHTEQINDIQYFSGGLQALTCGLDQTVRIFDCERQGSLIYEFPGRSPQKVAILNQNYFLAAGDELALFSRDKRKPLMSIKAINLISIEENDQSYLNTQFTCISTIPGFNLVVFAVNGTIALAQLNLEIVNSVTDKSTKPETQTIYDLKTLKNEDDESLPITLLWSMKIGNGYINCIHLFVDQKTNEISLVYSFGIEQPNDRIGVKDEGSEIQHVGVFKLGKAEHKKKSRFA